MTVNIIYDDAVFLINDEAKCNVQQIVESPEIYIFGRSRYVTTKYSTYCFTAERGKEKVKKSLS